MVSHTPPAVSTTVLALVREALADLGRPDAVLSIVADKAMRIARLTGDYDRLMWLSTLVLAIGQKSHTKMKDEVRAAIGSEADALGTRITEETIKDRTVNDPDKTEPMVLPFSLAEIEERIRQHDALRNVVGPAESPSDRLALAKFIRVGSEQRQVLARVRAKIHDFLSQVEHKLMLGEVGATAFERYRAFVDRSLTTIAPDVLDQLASAYRRQREGDREARAHALTSCRRVLKSVADVLYPPNGARVVGADGKERVMSDDKFISRLIQYVHEHGRKSTSAGLLRTQIDSLDNTLKALVALQSKGVHAEVSSVEVDQCVIQTYVTIGDLLRMREATEAS